MAQTCLPPGFRFHPTDVELVSYYLKRKIMGKEFTVEAISELELYKFAPWDLPDKSYLQSKEFEWFFFCPNDKKYPKGARTNRATPNGYWKTSGKDKKIVLNSRTVGLRKTLIFHEGKAPNGTRTDWVMYEYKLEDPDLVTVDYPKDTYVLCKIFKKSGLGSSIHEQYGAPFDENEWEELNSKTDAECSRSVVRSLFGVSSLSSTPPASLPTEDEQMVNKILHENGGAFAVNSDDASTIEKDFQARVRITMEKAFWDVVIGSMKGEKPDYSQLIDLVKEVRDSLHHLAPKGNEDHTSSVLAFAPLSDVEEPQVESSDVATGTVTQEPPACFLQYVPSSDDVNVSSDEVRGAAIEIDGILLNELSFFLNNSSHLETTCVESPLQPPTSELEAQALEMNTSDLYNELSGDAWAASNTGVTENYLQQRYSDLSAPVSPGDQYFRQYPLDESTTDNHSDYNATLSAFDAIGSLPALHIFSDDCLLFPTAY